jgi:hypothetical protein
VWLSGPENAGRSAKYALVVGNKVYTLDGREPDLDKLAGESATVRTA